VSEPLVEAEAERRADVHVAEAWMVGCEEQVALLWDEHAGDAEGDAGALFESGVADRARGLADGPGAPVGG